MNEFLLDVAIISSVIIIILAVMVHHILARIQQTPVQETEKKE